MLSALVLFHSSVKGSTMHTTELHTAPMYTPDTHTADMHVERVPGLPDSAYWEMTEASIELRRHEAADAKAFADGRTAAKREFEGKLTAAIGAQHLAAYRADHDRRRHVLREARAKITLDPATTRQYHVLRRDLVGKSRAFLETIGVNPEQLRRISVESHQSLQALFDRTIGRGENAPPPAAKRAKNHTFTPSFNGSAVSVAVSVHKGDSSDVVPNPSVSTWASFQTGEVGSSTSCSCTDASDYDEVSVNVRSAMRQWFQMPAEGQVRATSTLEVINTNYSGHVYDEWGWSDIDLKQSLRYYAQVTSPVISPRVYYYPVIGYQNHVTDPEADPWSGARWPAGQLNGILQQLVIPGVFTKDKWVLVDVGVENSNWFNVNDTEAWSHQTTHFWTKDIGLWSTGGP
jgi:hypothetical protein